MLWVRVRVRVLKRTQTLSLLLTLSSMSRLRTVVSSTAIVAVLAFGFGSWFVMTPREEERKVLVKNMPESNPAKMEEMRKRNALMMQVLKEAAQSKDNIARDMGGPVK